jgi:hypothetical protein
MYDIVFISYNEPKADENFAQLKSRFPLAKRVNGVKGIHQAHIIAAKKSFTKMLWVVDADAIILNTFNFDYQLTDEELDIVHVWRSRNPLNGLEYGYGGVKLLPKQLTINMNTDTTDMTMNISTQFKAMNEISNITAFNTDEFSTWRSAFRECTKLSAINNEEAVYRLNVWCTTANGDYADFALEGANAGREYGKKNASNLEALIKINDFNWLSDQFIHHGEHFSNNTSAS